MFVQPLTALQAEGGLPHTSPPPPASSFPLISVAQLMQIATVDKYQGQQNDYILLSLVRTRAVGHIRDVRRLVVALSRARLGLYIFGRAELFANCYELRPAMKQLLARPHQLHLHPSERHAVSLLYSPLVIGHSDTFEHCACL